MQAFEKLLLGLGSEFSLDELRARLAGTIHGLDHVSPSHVMHEIFLSNGSEEIFPDQAIADEFLKHFLVLWNEIADWPMEEPLPVVLKADEFNGDNGAWDDHEMVTPFLLSALDGRISLVACFNMGLDDSTPFPEEVLNEDAANSIRWLSNYEERLLRMHSKFANLMESDVEDPEFKRLRDLAWALLIEGEGAWPRHSLAIRTGIRALRDRIHEGMASFGDEEFWNAEDAPDPTPVTRNGPKVGRNDACSCGSGKKHKRCCG